MNIQIQQYQTSIKNESYQRVTQLGSAFISAVEQSNKAIMQQLLERAQISTTVIEVSMHDLLHKKEVDLQLFEH